MDSRTLLRRTPAGDAEIARPANGLSITQRRILTLLDAPGRLDDMPLGPAIDGERLQREATRLANAGLIAYEREDARRAVAANAVDVRRLGTPLARVLAAIVTLGVVGAVVWTGWQFSAPPAAAKPQHAIVVAKPATTNVPAAVAEPAVIATRVLRDPRPVAPPPRVVAETPNAPAPAAHAEPRAEP